MSNLNCTNHNISSSTNVANQLRFITLCQNGSIANAAQNNMGVNNTAVKIHPAQTQTVTPQSNIPKYQYNLAQDSTNFSEKHEADDGKISTKDKIINFGKGAISPITTMFSSPKNFALGAAGIIGGGLLIAATAGAAAPVMVALGAAGGTIGLIKNGLNAMNAKTDDEAKKAWQGLGLGASVTLGSIAGSKAALKGAGVNIEGLNPFSATIQCFKTMPAQVGKSISTFTSGEAVLNIKNALHIKNKDTKQSNNKQEIEKPAKQADTEGTTEIKNVDNGTETQTVAVDAQDGTNTVTDIETNPTEDIGTIDKPKTVKPKKTPKPSVRRQSRIKHNVPKKKVQQVQKEAKSITQILDDFANNNNVDQQFKITVENVRRIAENPMESPKNDTKALISAIKHLESCKDNPESIALDGKITDFPFDDAISYVEKLLSGEYKIDRLQAKIGDIFDGTIMSAFEPEFTTDKKLDGTVFKMLNSGFRKQGKAKPDSGWKIKVRLYSTKTQD